jgi:hypothetical protein
MPDTPALAPAPSPPSPPAPAVPTPPPAVPTPPPAPPPPAEPPTMAEEITVLVRSGLPSEVIGALAKNYAKMQPGAMSKLAAHFKEVLPPGVDIHPEFAAHMISRVLAQNPEWSKQNTAWVSPEQFDPAAKPPPPPVEEPPPPPPTPSASGTPGKPNPARSGPGGSSPANPRGLISRGSGPCNRALPSGSRPTRGTARHGRPRRHSTEPPRLSTRVTVVEVPKATSRPGRNPWALPVGD